MKALVAQELSGPAGLVYTDAPDPANPDQVVIDVGAAGVCFPDLLLLRGEYQMRLDPPFVPGMEVAGVVRSAPQSSGFTAGQRVSAFTMLGGYAEQVAVAPDAVVSTPADIDDASAASLLGNYYTMQFALQRRGALHPGETVLVLGSAGGVGTAAVQIASRFGCEVIALAGSVGVAPSRLSTTARPPRRTARVGSAVTRLITSVSCTGQPSRAQASVTADTCGSTRTDPAPYRRIRVAPMPCSIGSPEATTCTVPAPPNRVAKAGINGDGHRHRDAVTVESSRSSWRGEP